jgi:hypothetical protein
MFRPSPVCVPLCATRKHAWPVRGECAKAISMVSSKALRLRLQNGYQHVCAFNRAAWHLHPGTVLQSRRRQLSAQQLVCQTTEWPVRLCCTACSVAETSHAYSISQVGVQFCFKLSLIISVEWKCDLVFNHHHSVLS